MSGAVLVWLVLCGSLAAPRLARGERTGSGDGGKVSRQRRSSLKVGAEVCWGIAEAAVGRVPPSGLAFSSLINPPLPLISFK